MPEESQNGEAPSASSDERTGKEESGEEKPQECGVVMPISAIDGRSKAHWVEVRDILFEPIREAGFEPSLVSDTDEVAVIQQSIVQNLFDNEVVVCDVSAGNPNVMFELGLRLAFDKPTVIVKDDDTDYSFDTSVIEHLTYPRSLRYQRILDFKERLARKVSATANRAQEDEHYSPFLKHFKRRRVMGDLGEEEVSRFELLGDGIDEIKRMLAGVDRRQRSSSETINLGGSDSSHVISQRIYRDLKSVLEEVDGKPIGEFTDGEIASALTSVWSGLGSETIAALIQEDDSPIFVGDYFRSEPPERAIAQFIRGRNAYERRQ